MSLAVAVGAVAPEFTLRNQNRQEVALSAFRGRRPVLLVFFPAAFTGVCQGELRELQDRLGDFAATEVFGISVDTVYSLRVWGEREGYTIPLLSDFWPHGAVAQAYGVFNERGGTANRGTFLVDAEGVVRFAEMNGPGEPRDQNVWRDALAAL